MLSCPSDWMPELNMVIIKCNHNQIKRKSENCEYLYLVIAASLVGQKILSKMYRLDCSSFFFCVCREDTCTAFFIYTQAASSRKESFSRSWEGLGASYCITYLAVNSLLKPSHCFVGIYFSLLQKWVACCCVSRLWWCRSLFCAHQHLYSLISPTLHYG